MGIRRPAEAAPVLHPPACSVGLIGRVGLALCPQLLVQPPLGFLEPLRPRRRDRPGLLRAPVIQPALGLTQPAPSTLGGRELGRQFVAAPIAEALVLFGVDAASLFQDLARELLVVAI